MKKFIKCSFALFAFTNLTGCLNVSTADLNEEFPLISKAPLWVEWSTKEVDHISFPSTCEFK